MTTLSSQYGHLECIKDTHTPVLQISGDEYPYTLESLRGIARDMLSQHIELVDESETPIVGRKINDGKGFLVVPASYTSGASKDVYEYPDGDEGEPESRHVSFYGVPVMYCHFKEIVEILSDVKILDPAHYADSVMRDYRSETAAGGWRPEYGITWGEPSDVTYTSMYEHFDFLANNPYAPPPDVVFSMRASYGTLEITVKPVPDEEPIGEPMLYCYRYESHSRHPWGGESITEETKEWVLYPEGGFVGNTPTTTIEDGDEGGGYSKGVAALKILIDVSVHIDLPPEPDFDHGSNLLVAKCGAERFNSCFPESSRESRAYLGVTSSQNDMVMVMYATTVIERPFNALYASWMEGAHSDIGAISEVDGAKFAFSYLIRPNGAFVPIYWTFNANDQPRIGYPVSKKGYSVYRSDLGFEVEFPDGIVHVFSPVSPSGYEFSFAYDKKKGAEFGISWNGQPQIEDDYDPVTGANIYTVTSAVGSVVIRILPGSDNDTSPVYRLPDRIINIIYNLPDGTLVGRIDFDDDGPNAYVPDLDWYSPNSITVSHFMVLGASGTLSLVSNYTISGGGGGGGESVTWRTPLGDGFAERINSWITMTPTGKGPIKYSSTQTQTVVDPAGSGMLSFVTNYQYTSISSVLLPERVTTGAGSDDVREVRMGYYPNGRIKFRLEHEGYWVYYYYDEFRRVRKEVKSFGNIKLEFDVNDEVIPPNEALCDVTIYSYSVNDPGGETPETYGDLRVRMERRVCANVEVSLRYHLFYEFERRDIVCTVAGAAWNASTNLVTRTTYYQSGSFNLRDHKIYRPDGTMTIYAYAAITGAADGAVLEITAATGAPNSGKTAIVDGTKTISRQDAVGDVLSVTQSDIVTNLVTSRIEYERDWNGRVTKTTYMDGSTEETSYACCGPIRVKYRDGSVRRIN